MAKRNAGSKAKNATGPTTPRKSAVKSKATAKTVKSANAKGTGKTATSQQPDWRAETLAEVRRLIQEADSEIVEERKWVKPTNPNGVATWSHAGIVCTGEVYKQAVKLTFAKGASLADPRKLFNSSLDGNTRRAIDIKEGESLDATAFKALIQAAVAHNLEAAAPKSKAVKKTTEKARPVAKEAKPAKAPKAEEVVLLSGGNPQITKADGDAPVQEYINRMPDWKRDIGKRLDALIERLVPNLQKAVKWNSPFYGVKGNGWFVSFHVFARFVKVTFFKGTSLKPAPDGGLSKEARWIDIHEDDFDEKQLTAWIKQAAELPGWMA
jgi:hypothetical protein